MFAIKKIQLNIKFYYNQVLQYKMEFVSQIPSCIAKKVFVCLGEDLNLHVSRHKILSLACLPFHHQGCLTAYMKS